MEIQCSECAGFLAEDVQIGKNQTRILWVVFFNVLMMVGEIAAGYITGSMALTAEGWHMASHVGALSITLSAYFLARSPRLTQKLSFGPGKLIPLGGYTSAIILAMVALFVFIESVEHLFRPEPIQFNEALLVAGVGLLVNLVSAVLLGHSHDTHHHHSHEGEVPCEDDHSGHHHHDEHHKNLVHDHNVRSAFLHILADAVTSVLAIGALFLGKKYQWTFLDPVIGIVGSLVILSWAYQLCRDTGWELLDGHSKSIDWKKLRNLVEVDGVKILDFHVWRIAPKAVSCELIVQAKVAKGIEHYREILSRDFGMRHIVIEERVLTFVPTAGEKKTNLLRPV